MLKPLLPDDEPKHAYVVTQTVTMSVVVRATDQKDAMIQAVSTPQELWSKELGELEAEKIFP